MEGASGKEDLFGKKVHQDIECQAFWRALSVTEGPYNSEGRQVWMGWEYGKWQRGRFVSEWHQTFIMVLKRASHPDGRCTVKCMLLQKGAVNYCGCISRIEGAYSRIVGASAPTKRYKITPLLPETHTSETSPAADQVPHTWLKRQTIPLCCAGYTIIRSMFRIVGAQTVPRPRYITAVWLRHEY